MSSVSFDGLSPPLTCIVGLLVGGVRSPGGKPKWLPVHPGGRRRGEDRTGLRHEVARSE